MYNITKTEFEILINKGLKVSQIAEVIKYMEMQQLH